MGGADPLDICPSVCGVGPSSSKTKNILADISSPRPMVKLTLDGRCFYLRGYRSSSTIPPISRF